MPDKSEKRILAATLAALLAAAAAFRIAGIATRPFWVGEVQEVVGARSQKAIMLIHRAGSDLVGYLYHHLLFLLGIDSRLELWQRIPALLCGIASVWLLYLLGRRIHSAAAGLAAAALLALSFFHVYHSQDGRALSTLTFGALLFVYSAIRVVLDARPRFAWTMVAGTAFLALSHLFGFLLFVLLCLLFFAVAWHNESRVPQPSGRPLLRFLAASLATVPVAALQAWGSGVFFVQARTGSDVCATGLPLLDRLRFFPLLLTYFTSAPGWWVVPFVLLALLGLLALWWKDRTATILVAGWLLVPTTLLALLRFTGKVPHLDISHLLYLLPPFLLLLAAGLVALFAWLHRLLLHRGPTPAARLLAPLAAALLLAAAANASPLLRYYQRDTRLNMAADFRTAGQLIERHGVDRYDLLAFDYSVELFSLNYYVGHLFSKAHGIIPYVPDRDRSLLRLYLHAGDDMGGPERPTLTSDRVWTLAEFARGSAPYTGAVWVALLRHEELEDLHCGIAPYARWFEASGVYLAQAGIPDSELPPGFVIHRLPGLDLLHKRYLGVPRSVVVDEIAPLLYRYAPDSARAFFPDVFGPVERER
jgi:hypothetical protein